MISRISLLTLLFVSMLSFREIAAQELYVVPQQPLSVTKSPIQTAKLNPKGDLLAIAGVEKSIKILDGATLKERVALTARSGRIMTLAFSRDGKYLISAGGDGLITIWSMPEGALLKEFPAGGAGLGVRSLDVDPAGRIVSGGGDGETKLWGIGVDNIIGIFPKGTNESEVLSVAFDATARYVAVGSADGTVRIFDPQTYVLVQTLTEHKDKITAMAYSTNGKYFATGSADSTIRVWDAQRYTLLQTLRSNSGAITSLSFHPTNPWLASTASGIKIWDVSTGALRKTIADTGKSYTAAIFSPDTTTLFAATASGGVESFTVLAQKPDKEPPVLLVQKPTVKESEPYKLYAGEIEISGVAADESGVRDVSIGGLSQSLTEVPADELLKLGLKVSGKKFSATAQLPTVGINDISVAATDERGNTSTKSIHVQRLAKEFAVEIINPKENAETGELSMSLEFKVWFEYTRYTIALNTIEIVNRENLPRKSIGALHVESLSLSSGFNQIQLVVHGKGGERISKIVNVTRQVLSGPVASQPDKPMRGSLGQPQQWAVIIGISEYANPTIKNLSYADRDARDFAEFLKSTAGGGFEPERMKILLNKEATLQNIKQALNSFLRQTVDKDLVVIYFAGHGAPEPANPSNNYLLPYDTDPNSLETSAFPMWDVNTALTRYIPSKRVIVFTDACHSGGISSDLATRGVSLTESNLINQYLADLSKSKEGTIVFTASQAGEVSQELDKFGHGVFTYYLLKGMKGEADINNDYTVTIGELMDYVEENVKRQTKGNQHPTRNQGTYDKDLTISMIPH
jgi:WD40 repeat protein